MKKMVVLLVLPFLLCGCTWRKMPTGPMCRVVTQVQVVATAEGQSWENTYTDSPRIESVLCYLRLLKRGKTANIDPGSFRSDTYEITLFYSDGQRTTYRQLYRDFLQKDDGAWKKIEGAKIELLFP